MLIAHGTHIHMLPEVHVLWILRCSSVSEYTTSPCVWKLITNHCHCSLYQLSGIICTLCREYKAVGIVCVHSESRTKWCSGTATLSSALPINGQIIVLIKLMCVCSVGI